MAGGPKFFKEFPKFSKSKIPDGSMVQIPSLKPEKLKATLAGYNLFKDVVDTSKFTQKTRRIRTVKKIKKEDKDEPSFQDVFRDGFLQYLDKEIKKIDGIIPHEEPEELASADPFSFVTVNENVRRGITKKEVIDKFEKLISKCKCPDCERDLYEFDTALEAAKADKEGNLDKVEQKLFDALFYDKDREFFRRKHERRKKTNRPGILDLPDFVEVEAKSDEHKINLDDYNKRTDSDDDDPLINLSRKLEKFDFNTTSADFVNENFENLEYLNMLEKSSGRAK